MDTKTKPSKVKLTGDITHAPLKVRTGVQAGAGVQAGPLATIGGLKSHPVDFRAWGVGG